MLALLYWLFCVRISYDSDAMPIRNGMIIDAYHLIQFNTPTPPPHPSPVYMYSQAHELK